MVEELPASDNTYCIQGNNASKGLKIMHDNSSWYALTHEAGMGTKGRKMR